MIDSCCFYYFVRNSLIALLEGLCVEPHPTCQRCGRGVRYRLFARVERTIGSIADELVAEILCDWALVSASKALEQSRFEFAHDWER